MLVSASLALAACSGANAPTASGTIGSANRVSPTTASPGTTAAPTTKPQTEEDRVIEAYRRLWDEIVAANNPPNPDSPGLKLVATDEMLDKISGQVRENLATGKGTRFASPSRFRVVPSRVEIVGSEADLQACMTDDLVSVRQTDGTPLDSKVVTRHLIAHLRLENGEWLTSSNKYVDSTEGVDQCDR